jgi:hypothetical protein
VDTGNPETSTHVWSIQSTKYNSLREELEVMQEMVHNLRWSHIGAFWYLYKKLKHRSLEAVDQTLKLNGSGSYDGGLKTPRFNGICET